MASPVTITPIDEQQGAGPVTITPIGPDLTSQNALIDRMQADAAGGGVWSGIKTAAGNIGNSLLNAVQHPMGHEPTEQEVEVQQMREGQHRLAQKAAGYGLVYRTAAGVGEQLGVDVAGMEDAARKGQSGTIVGKAAVPATLAVAPILKEGAVAAAPPLARASGALLENVGKYARTPISDVKVPLIGDATAAKALGGTAGYAVGRPIGHPFVGATTGAALGDIAAERVQTAGAKLRDWGGYNRPPAPRTPAEGRPIPALRWSTTVAPAETSPIAGPQGQPVRAATPAGTGRTVITPGEHIDPLRTASAGSAAQATEADLQRLAAVGDQSAAAELTRRRLVREGQPTNYSQVPLPKGRLIEAVERAKKGQ